MANASRDPHHWLHETNTGSHMALTPQERQATYRERLAAVDKVIIRATVARDVAAKLRRMAHNDVTRTGAVIAKALDALEAMESGMAATAK